MLDDCFTASWAVVNDEPVASPVPAPSFAVAGSTLPDPAFLDVPYGHPFFLDIEWLAAEGISTGYPDGTFRPAVVVSRQAFASFLYEEAGSPNGAGGSPPAFSDVDETHPFFAAIEWAHEEGIVAGYDDGTFRPEIGVSRQAAAQWVMLATTEFAPVPDGAPFPDVPHDHPFAMAIAWMADEGIAAGYPDGGFRPAAPVSRQAAAAWLHRASE